MVYKILEQKIFSSFLLFFYSFLPAVMLTQPTTKYFCSKIKEFKTSNQIFKIKIKLQSKSKENLKINTT